VDDPTGGELAAIYTDGSRNFRYVLKDRHNHGSFFVLAVCAGIATPSGESTFVTSGTRPFKGIGNIKCAAPRPNPKGKIARILATVLGTGQARDSIKPDSPIKVSAWAPWATHSAPFSGKPRAIQRQPLHWHPIGTPLHAECEQTGRYIFQAAANFHANQIICRIGIGKQRACQAFGSNEIFRRL